VIANIKTMQTRQWQIPASLLCFAVSTWSPRLLGHCWPHL